MISRYARPLMVSLWSDEKRLDTWLQVELAACEAMEAAPSSVIPRGVAQELRESAEILRPWDLHRLAEIEAQTHHDVVAFLTYLEERLGHKARFLHLGMTSSDMLDTALAILLKEATEMILESIRQRLLPCLYEKAIAHKYIPMMGRSHGIHAEPITLGVVFASFYAEQVRSMHRLERALAGISVGKLSGVVGVYGSGLLSPNVEKTALAKLGLVPETVSTQIIPRDRHAELFLSLALLGAGIERIATTVRHWQRTEVGEAEESFGAKQKGSSAMPHKKNPILSENLCGLARLLRAEASASLENIALWHERDISHSSVERVIAADVTTVADFMVARASDLVANLAIKPDRMKQNLARTEGLFFSEKVLLALIEKGLPRQMAYEIVQRNALRAGPESQFQELLAKDTELAKYLSIAELTACFDMKKHLRHIDEIFERTFSATP